MNGSTTPEPLPRGYPDGFHVYHLYTPHPTEADRWTLVYVGQTENLTERFRQHERTQWWWPVIDPDHTYLEAHPDRRSALRAEARYITTLLPAVNISGHPVTVYDMDWWHERNPYFVHELSR